jgi:hypothetical protein
MTANELRIGNWVMSHHNTRIKIDAISDTHVGYSDKNDYWRDQTSLITPIPLTPEILEKAGFSENDASGSDVKFWDFPEEPTVDLLLRLYDEQGYDLLDMEFQQIHYDHKILYLHQLQNLYFALTGEELNIEL